MDENTFPKHEGVLSIKFNIDGQEANRQKLYAFKERGMAEKQKELFDKE
jgi:hypothetical protein